MRIITEEAIRGFISRYPDAATWLATFVKLARPANWRSILDVRAVYPHADIVKVASGRNVVVINAKGNSYRLILAIHYNRSSVFVMRFLTHADYSKGSWKKTL